MRIMHISPVDSHPCFSYLIDDQRKDFDVINVVLKKTQRPASIKYRIREEGSKIIVEGVKGGLGSSVRSEFKKNV